MFLMNHFEVGTVHHAQSQSPNGLGNVDLFSKQEAREIKIAA